MTLNQLGVVIEEKDEADRAAGAPSGGDSVDLAQREGNESTVSFPPAVTEPSNSVSTTDTMPSVRKAEAIGAISATETAVRQRAEAAYQDAVSRAAERLAHDDARWDLNYKVAQRMNLGSGYRGANTADRDPVAHYNYRMMLARDAQNLRVAQINEDRERQRLHHAEELRFIDDASRTFGVPSPTLAPDSEPVKKDAEDRKRALQNYQNDRHNDGLGLWEKAGNHTDRQAAEQQSGNAINLLHRIQKFKDTTKGIAEKIKKGELLSPDDDAIWENRHNLARALDRRTREALGDLTAAQATLARIPRSSALRKLDDAKSVGELLTVLNGNFEEVVVLGVAGSVDTIAAGAAGSLFLGPLGGILAATSVAFGSEFPAAVIEAFKRRNINLQDEAAVLAVIRDQKKMQEIYIEASAVAGIDATMELAGGAGGVLSRPIRRQFGKAVASGAETVGQGAIGAAGEMAKNIATGEDIELGKLGREFIDGIISDRTGKAIEATGRGLKNGAMRAGAAIEPRYQEFLERNVKGSVPIDYNRIFTEKKKNAEQAQRDAAGLATSIARQQKDGHRYGDKDDGTKRLESSYLGPKTLHLSRAEADRLRRNGILTDNVAKKLGISKDWLDTPDSTGDVKIRAIALLTSGLKREHVEDFTRSVRSAPDAMSARDAGRHLAERKAHLERISATYRKPGPTPPDGWTTYRHVFHVARMRRMTFEEAHMKAAEVTDHFINRAILGGTGKTADTLFLEEYASSYFGLDK